jgi:hypothetical protein
MQVRPGPINVAQAFPLAAAEARRPPARGYLPPLRPDRVLARCVEDYVILATLVIGIAIHQISPSPTPTINHIHRTFPPISSNHKAPQ